jgi:hypothetical protein
MIQSEKPDNSAVLANNGARNINEIATSVSGRI